MNATNLSVILPVYNGMPFLKEAVTSLCNQTYQNFIIYAIDNGSDDGTAEYLNQVDDKRVNYVRLEENNLVKAINTGLEMADTQFIARMDSDDLIHPSKFEKQIKYLENYVDVSLVGTLGYYISLDGKRKFRINLPLSHNEIVSSMLKVNNAIIHPSIMFRKEIINTFGGYNEDSFPAEDYEFFLRISDRTKLANIPERLHSLRVRKNSIISIYIKESIEKYYQVADTYSKNYNLINTQKFPSTLRKKVDSISLAIYRKGLHIYLNVNTFSGIIYFIIASIINPSRLVNALKRRITIRAFTKNSRGKQNR